MNLTPVKDSSLEGLSINIPTLPHTLMLAMGLSREADTIAIDDVVDVIQNDPGAVTRVLRVVNSAFYGMRKEITTIRRAVVVMGPEAVLGILMSMSLGDMKDSMNIVDNQIFNRLVRHSIATGFLTKQLVLKSRLVHDENTDRQEYLNEAFTMGLLHDFGKIVILYNYPNEAAELYDSVSAVDTPNLQLLDNERKVFGFDHVQAGKHLMDALNFLPFMTKVVAHHHSWTAASSFEPSLQHLLYFVAAGNKLANSLGYSFNHTISRLSVQQDPMWDVMLQEKVFDVEDKEALFLELFGLSDQVSGYVNEVT